MVDSKLVRASSFAQHFTRLYEIALDLIAFAGRYQNRKDLDRLRRSAIKPPDYPLSNEQTFLNFSSLTLSYVK